MIVYLQCANNNCAATVVDLFQAATQQFGIPSRVRADRGGEDSGVARFIVTHQGGGRGSFISGLSVHNQRIERFGKTCLVGALFCSTTSSYT